MGIKVERLNFGYIKRPLSLIDVSFDISDGEVIALLGGEGAGKTSLLNVLTGLKKQYIGKILYDNKNIEIGEKKLGISYLLSEPAFFKNKSILYNLQYQLKVNNITMSDNDIINIFNKFEFKFPLKIKVKKLKNVDKKILSIIRSYFKSPRFIFIDDMFYGLNKEDCERLKNAILTLINEKKWVKTIILAENSNIFDFKFNKIFYLNYGHLDIFSSFEDLKNQLIDLQALNYFKHTKKDYYLAFDGNNYFLIKYKDSASKDRNKKISYMEEKRLLLDQKFYNQLGKCALKTDQEMEVTLTSLEMINFDDSFDDINNCLTFGKINIFEKNTFVKIL